MLTRCPITLKKISGCFLQTRTFSYIITGNYIDAFATIELSEPIQVLPVVPIISLTAKGSNLDSHFHVSWFPSIFLWLPWLWYFCKLQASYLQNVLSCGLGLNSDIFSSNITNSILHSHCILSICPFTNGNHINHMVKTVSAKPPCCNITFPLPPIQVINKYFMARY